MSCSEKQMIQRLWQNLTVRPQRLGSSAQYLQSPASSGAVHRLDLYKDTMGYKDNSILKIKLTFNLIMKLGMVGFEVAK